MKLKLPKMKKKLKISSPSARKIARRLNKGYKAKSSSKNEASGAGGGGTIPAGVMPQNLKIQLEGSLKEREKEEKKGPVKSRYEGIELPSANISFEDLEFSLPESLQEIRSIDSKYPLVPNKPKKGEPVSAYAHIKWDEKMGSLVYNVIESQVSEEDKKIIQTLKRNIEERLDVDFSKLGKVKGKEMLMKEVDSAISEMPSMDKRKIPMLKYNIEKEIIGMGIIEPLMQDPEIEDISCDGAKIPIFVYHRNPQFGSLRTLSLIHI